VGSPQVVVVTGASAGVGRATALAFARRGARVALLARGHDGLDGAREQVEAAGARALVLPTDVADPEQVENAARAAEDELGPIDVWVNNAMTTVFAPLSDISPDEFRRATEVTYLGTVHGTMSALKRMRRRECGVVVNVGSALAYRGIPLQAPYCGAKHAIKGFTESVRCELLHEGSRVHVTMVHLPALNTPQFHWCRTRLPRHPRPVPPIYAPELAAEAIVWASERRRREVFVGGPSVATVWANKLAPWLVDRYLGRTGYDAQQTDRPVEAGRPDNLFEPAAGDYGAHGEFSDRSKERSLQWWITRHRQLWRRYGT
jgi:NAD(P)-dependent dehydrogenase (short-subunit alcohol dehydrogenase family)